MPDITFLLLGLQFCKPSFNSYDTPAVNAPCPPLILEGESDSVHAAHIRWCHCAHLLLRWYSTPPLRLEGAGGR